VNIFQGTDDKFEKPLAKAFASFVGDYFKKQTGVKSPENVKKALQKRSTQFSGNGYI
jgi:hypothetical protein